MEATRTSATLNHVNRKSLPLTDSLVYHVRSLRSNPNLLVTDFREPVWDPAFEGDYEFVAAVPTFDVEAALHQANALSTQHQRRSIVVGDVIVTPDGSVNRRELRGWSLIAKIPRGQLPPGCRRCEFCGCVRHYSELVNVSDDHHVRVCIGICEGQVLGN